MADVDINKFRASVVREGSKPASPGFIVSEGQSPTDPAGSGQNHLPVTITTVATGLSITESQVLGGAGTVGQYIRGDGSLADFPATTGGGSSVSYYLNGSVSQGTIGGVAYKQLNRTPVFGAGTDISINADGYIASFITDASDPNKLLIPAGNWNFETYFSASSNGGSPSFYVELYKYDGTTFTLIATSSSAPELIAFGTSLNPYYSTLAVPQTTLALTDRLALRYYVTHSGRTITLHTENGHLCQIITTFTTGLTALNGLTAQVQNFAVGTSGTDFAIASATATHTFNLPTASATNRGALSSADWTTFNNKTSNLGTVTSVGLSSATSGVTIGSTPVTTSGTITLAIATASGSQNGLLSSTDWTTFNSKQNALTNPVTGTGASGQVGYFTSTTAISSESNLVWDAANNRLGINTTPAYSLDVNGIGQFGNTSNNTNAIQFLDANSTKTHLGSAFGATFIQNNNYYNGSAYVFDDNTIGSANVTLSAGTINFQTGTANVNPSTKLTMFSNGNVFIGTSPSDNGARLQVSGSVTTMATITSSGTASGLQLTNLGGTASSWIIQSDGGAVAGQAALRFYSLTASAYRMSIDGSGNVGIGTTSPVWMLEINKDTTSAITGGYPAISVNNPNANGFGAYYFYKGTTQIGGLEYSNGNNTLSIIANSATRISITSAGIVDIAGPLVVRGTLPANQTSAAVIDFNQNRTRFFAFGNGSTIGSFAFLSDTGGGSTIATINGTTGAYTAVSDVNKKKDFEDSNIGLNAILGLKPTLYRMKNDNPNSEKQLGFIAQEVKDYIKQAYVEKDDFIGLNYNSIIPVLVKAIQELNEKIK